MSTVTAPYVLPPNVPPTFYRGGGHIRAFRSQAGYEDVSPGPEDWIGSVVARWGGGDAGQSRLADGTPLRDALAGEHPPLVKLLDPGQRLPVHVHPDDAFAAGRLHQRNGKAEAWIVLAAGAEPAQLGWSRDVGRAEVEDWVRRQDVAGMRAVMNDVDVEPGSVLYVPPGVPHCLPEGCFILEIQQPADLSILLEWQGFSAEEDAFLGLPLTDALDAVRFGRSDPAGLVAPGWFTAPQGLGAGVPAAWSDRRSLPEEARRYFRVDRLVPGSTHEAALRTVIVLAGAGRLRGEFGDLDLRAGMTLVVPAGSGDITVEGDAAVIAVTGPES